MQEESRKRTEQLRCEKGIKAQLRIGEQLWQRTRLLSLRRKPLAVLRYLMEHAGEVVTKDALLAVVWPDIHVSEEGLTVHMREIRKALGDDARTPRFIETVHGRGYRFIAPSPLPPTSFKFQVPSFKFGHSALSTLPWWAGRRNSPKCMVGRPRL
jgi:hypothetical protein